MANDASRVEVSGHLGKDPEIRYSQDGKAIASFSIACTKSRKNNNGDFVDETSWFEITAFGKQAEIVKNHLGSGKRVRISGTLKQESWDDKDGNKRYAVKIIAFEVEPLLDLKTLYKGSTANNGGGQPQQQSAPAAQQSAPANDTPPDDVPF